MRGFLSCFFGENQQKIYGKSVLRLINSKRTSRMLKRTTTRTCLFSSMFKNLSPIFPVAFYYIKQLYQWSPTFPIPWTGSDGGGRGGSFAHVHTTCKYEASYTHPPLSFTRKEHYPFCYIAMFLQFKIEMHEISFNIFYF